MEHAASSVTITSVTTVCAFAVGANIDFRAVGDYCVFLALGVFCVYVLFLSFFMALIALDAQVISYSRACLLELLDCCLQCTVCSALCALARLT